MKKKTSLSFQVPRASYTETKTKTKIEPPRLAVEFYTKLMCWIYVTFYTSLDIDNSNSVEEHI